MHIFVLSGALQRDPHYPATKDATRKDMVLELRKWLSGARDRDGGRTERADKKNEHLPPPQKDSDSKTLHE